VTFSEAQVSTAINRAADDVIELAGSPDQGVRDAANLIVNAAMTYLADPDATLEDAVGCYGDDVTLDEIADWIAS
jgi:hypothetical protein